MSAISCQLAQSPTREEVLQQLDLMLVNRRFSAAERNARFLRYVVEQSLDGHADELKETVVAMEIYGRSAGYDPKVDSIVRVEASRLRSRIQSYYENEGAADPIRISIPKGTYVPQFELVPVEETATEPEFPLSPEPPESRPAARSYKGKWLLRGSRWAFAVLVVVAVMKAWEGRPRADHRPTTNAEAFGAWQEGTSLLSQDPYNGEKAGMPSTLRRALERFEFAVAKDPQFAQGWASLSEAYDYAFPYIGRDRTEDAKRAEMAAKRAIALDDQLAYGHAMLALYRWSVKWDFAGAEQEYRRVIELDPRNAWAIVEYADLLRNTGRTSRAADLIRQARALQPLLPVLALKEGEIQLDLHRPDAAIATARSVIETKRDSRRAHIVLGTALEAKGQFDEALASYRHALEINPLDRRALPVYGYLLARTGKTVEARAIAARLEDMNRNIRNCGYQLAVVYAGLGDDQKALDWLDHAHRTHQAYVPYVAVEPRFDSLRKYPRFQALVRKVYV